MMLDDEEDDLAFQDRVAWKALRKKGMALENQLQAKLDKYSSIPMAISRASKSKGRDGLSGVGSTVAMLEKDISDCIRVLKGIEKDMSVLLKKRLSAADTQSQAYTYQRFKSVIHTCQQEYNRTRDTVQTALNRANLLRDAGERESKRQEGRREDAGGMDALLREHGGLDRSINMTDQVIDMATASKNSIGEQGQTLRGANSKVNQLSKIFPRIDDLMKKITSHKLRDTIILALVIASCMFFTVIYWVSKD